MRKLIFNRLGLKIWAELDGDRMKLKPGGLLSPFGRIVTDPMNEYFANERPLAAGNGKITYSGWIPQLPSPAFDRLVTNQVKIGVTRRRIFEQVSIAVTGKCPCDCVFCCAKGIKSEPELTFDEMKDVIDQSVGGGAHLLTLDGGETLLRKDIYDIVAYANTKPVLTVLFTNGLFLTQDAAQRLKDAGLDTLQVSIDSPYPEEHDEIRGVEGLFEKATAGIRSAREVGLLTSVYYVARPQNCTPQTLDDLLALAVDLDADEVTVYDIIAIGKWLERENDTLSDDDRQRTIDFHTTVNAHGRTGPKVMAFSYFEAPDKFGCMAGRRWIHITPAGDVVPCSYTPITFGNVRETPLKKIWARIRAHREYQTENQCCMVADKEFRKKFIYPIPKDAQLPYPIDALS